MSNISNSNIINIIEKFKALSNPNRMSIFMKLASCCGGKVCRTDTESLRKCVGEISTDLSVVPSTVSHHIKELSRAGLVQTRRRGQNIECWIETKTLKELANFFLNLNGHTQTKRK